MYVFLTFKVARIMNAYTNFYDNYYKGDFVN